MNLANGDDGDDGNVISVSIVTNSRRFVAMVKELHECLSTLMSRGTPSISSCSPRIFMDIALPEILLLSIKIPLDVIKFYV